MSRYPDLYPAPEGIPARRRAVLGSTLMETVEESTTASRKWFRWRTAPIPAALVVAAVLALLQPWTTPAAWAAMPQRLDAAATARLANSCSSSIEDRHFPMAVSSAVATLAEARGSSTAVLLTSPSQVQICVAGPTSTFLGVYDLAPLTPGRVAVVDAVPGSREGGDPVRVIFGRLDSSSDTVTVTTADGLHVTVSVSASGASTYFLAWWPSHADAVSAVVTLPSGATETLSMPDQSPPLPARTTGG